MPEFSAEAIQALLKTLAGISAQAGMSQRGTSPWALHERIGRAIHGRGPTSAELGVEVREPELPEGKWFVDSRHGVPFQASANPDPDYVWRLVFHGEQLAEAYPKRLHEGYPLLVHPDVLSNDPHWLATIEQARLDQYEHPDFRVDWLRLHGSPPPEEEPGEGHVPANTMLDAWQGEPLRGYPGQLEPPAE